MKNQTIATLPDDLCELTITEIGPFVQGIRSVTGKWKPEILWLLVQRMHRFGELHRAVPGITRHMLTTQLRELEADGLVKRTVFAEIPPRVEYQVTDAILRLRPVLEAFLIACQDPGLADDPAGKPV